MENSIGKDNLWENKNMYFGVFILCFTYGEDWGWRNNIRIRDDVYLWEDNDVVLHCSLHFFEFKLPPGWKFSLSGINSQLIEIT